MDKLQIPAEKQTKLLEAIEKFGKPCLEEVKTKNPNLDVEAVLIKSLPVFEACVEKVKDIPADQVTICTWHYSIELDRPTMMLICFCVIVPW